MLVNCILIPLIVAICGWFIVLILVLKTKKAIVRNGGVCFGREFNTFNRVFIPLRVISFWFFVIGVIYNWQFFFLAWFMYGLFYLVVEVGSHYLANTHICAHIWDIWLILARCAIYIIMPPWSYFEPLSYNTAEIKPDIIYYTYPHLKLV